MPKLALPANTWTAVPIVPGDTWIQSTNATTYVDTVGATPPIADATPLPEYASIVFQAGLTVSLNPGGADGSAYYEAI